MKVYEKGVLNTSHLYFHTPSETAQKLFFYPVCCGDYFCDKDYRVERPDYSSFLLLHVKKGKGYVQVNGRKTPLADGSTFLLDCYQPHCYGTTTGWEIVWVHFNGQKARLYFDSISPNSNCRTLTLSNPHSIQQNLYKVFAMPHEKGVLSEPLANKYIVNALTYFLTHNPSVDNNSSSLIEELLTYITENLQKPLTVEMLANKAMLSPYYFIRVFKKETGYTPYAYIVTVRVNAAKFYLKTTSLTVKEITYMCGFSSESNFCTSFKRIVGTTPLDYRTSSL